MQLAQFIPAEKDHRAVSIVCRDVRTGVYVRVFIVDNDWDVDVGVLILKSHLMEVEFEAIVNKDFKSKEEGDLQGDNGDFDL